MRLMAVVHNNAAESEKNRVIDIGRASVDTNLLLQGVELMVLGMGIVFGFLSILVFTLRGMSVLAARLSGSEAIESPPQMPVNVSDHRQVVAAITAAVARYRASRVS